MPINFDVDTIAALRGLANISRLNAVKAKTNELSSFHRDLMCEYQLQLTNFLFVASGLYEDCNTWHTDERKIDSNSRELAGELSTLCGWLVESVREYFNMSHWCGDSPRVGILLRDLQNDCIIDIAMIPAIDSSTAKKPKNYTCFRHIDEQGVPFLENHLPKRIKTNVNYTHDGLDCDKVRKNYKIRWKDRLPFVRFTLNWGGKPEVDREWAACALYPTEGPMYKSHLVTPATYRKHACLNKLHPQLQKLLEIDGGRTILGYICVDHPSTHYFSSGSIDKNQNIDANVMYVFADMLSIVIAFYRHYDILLEEQKTRRN